VLRLCSTQFYQTGLLFLIMLYVVEGVSVFSHIYAPDESYDHDSYTLYFNSDDKTMLRFAEKDVDVKAIK
jgi:hypothetical protein